MNRWAGRVALVTGTSAGIGAAVTEAFVKEGLTVVGCDINLEKAHVLEKSLSGAKGKLHLIQCDVSQESEILAMFAEIKSKYKGVDICINNAGICPHSAELLSGKTETWRKMMDTNILAFTICMRETYKSMKERGVDDGQIINVNSIVAHEVYPLADASFFTGMAFAMRAITDAARKELIAEKSRIRVAEISPAVVKSDIHVGWRGVEGAKKFYETNPYLLPKDIADTILFILSTPAHVVVQEIIMTPTSADTPA